MSKIGPNCEKMAYSDFLSSKNKEQYNLISDWKIS